MIPAHPVPLEHAELGIVAATGFAVAKHAPQLIAIADAGGEQPLERILRRGPKPARGRTRIDMATEAGAETLDVRLGIACRREHRGFHFQHGALGEKPANQGIQARAQAQRLQVHRQFAGQRAHTA